MFVMFSEILDIYVLWKYKVKSSKEGSFHMTTQVSILAQTEIFFTTLGAVESITLTYQNLIYK